MQIFNTLTCHVRDRPRGQKPPLLRRRGRADVSMEEGKAILRGVRLLAPPVTGPLTVTNVMQKATHHVVVLYM